MVVWFHAQFNDVSAPHVRETDLRQRLIRRLTNDALFEVLVEAVVADLLKQQRVKLFESFEVFEMSVYNVQVFTRSICRPAIMAHNLIICIRFSLSFVIIVECYAS